MAPEAVILIVAAAATAGLVLFSAFLILLGRRAGRFGVFAAILATCYPILAYLLLTGVLSVLTPDPITGAMPTLGEILVAIVGRLVPVFVVLMLPLGWLLYTFRRYRQARQDELALVISAAVEAQMPLAPAVRAYLHDRPREGRAAWDAALLVLCPPGYLVWTHRRTFDDRVAHLSTVLAAGAPLAAALSIARGVAPAEMAVAAEVGEATGRLAECLHRADRDRLTGVWLEVAPRLLYPLLLLMIVGALTLFLSQSIAPKFQKIVADLHEEMPPITARLFGVMDEVDLYIETFSAALFGAVAIAILLVLSPTFRWHLPLVGRLFRADAQGLILRMLGVLFEADRPAPEALGRLASATALPAAVRRRLERARQAVLAGKPLANSLYAAGLLPASMAPLVSVAGRTRSLPSALFELGELLSGRAIRLIRRLSLILAPVPVVAVGVLVGFIVVGIFMPLIQVLTNLSGPAG